MYLLNSPFAPAVMANQFVVLLPPWTRVSHAAPPVSTLKSASICTSVATVLRALFLALAFAMSLSSFMCMYVRNHSPHGATEKWAACSVYSMSFPWRDLSLMQRRHKSREACLATYKYYVCVNIYELCRDAKYWIHRQMSGFALAAQVFAGRRRKLHAATFKTPVKPPPLKNILEAVVILRLGLSDRKRQTTWQYGVSTATPSHGTVFGLVPSCFGPLPPGRKKQMIRLQTFHLCQSNFSDYGRINLLRRNICMNMLSGIGIGAAVQLN